MKYIITILLISFQCIAFAQSKEHAGNYEFFKGNDNSYFLKDKLILNPNGTFLFKSHSFIEERLPSEKIEYGKGTWTSNKRLILLKVEDSDIDATHTLNLNNTKLRYDTKSPRDKSDRDIKTSVRVFTTEVFWLKGRTLIKNANTNPIIKKTICCKSIREVHSHLHGKWTKKNEPNKEYHYSLQEGNETFEVFKKTEKGELNAINEAPARIKILKSEKGFQIEHDFNGLKTYSTIKLLDAEKTILVRRDGKESTLYKVKE